MMPRSLGHVGIVFMGVSRCTAEMAGLGWDFIVFFCPIVRHDLLEVGEAVVGLNDSLAYTLVTCKPDMKGAEILRKG